MTSKRKREIAEWCRANPGPPLAFLKEWIGAHPDSLDCAPPYGPPAEKHIVRGGAGIVRYSKASDILQPKLPGVDRGI